MRAEEGGADAEGAEEEQGGEEEVARGAGAEWRARRTDRQPSLGTLGKGEARHQRSKPKSSTPPEPAAGGGRRRARGRGGRGGFRDRRREAGGGLTGASSGVGFALWLTGRLLRDGRDGRPPAVLARRAGSRRDGRGRGTRGRSLDRGRGAPTPRGAGGLSSPLGWPRRASVARAGAAIADRRQPAASGAGGPEAGAPRRGALSAPALRLPYERPRAGALSFCVSARASSPITKTSSVASPSHRSLRGHDDGRSGFGPHVRAE